MTARTRWLALLPASKGATDGGTGPVWGAVASAAAQEVLEALGDRDQGDDPLPLRDRPTTPAWRRYDGVVHRAADPATLETAVRRRWHRHVAYLSALAGLVRPTDPLPAYRLEMAASAGPLGGLGPFWRPHVRAALDASLAPGAVVWLLTGGEYARAVEVPPGRTLVEPRFLRADGTRSMPSATVKQARGQLARALVEHPDLARRPLDDGWRTVTLTCAGAPVRFDGADEHGVPRWVASS